MLAAVMLKFAKGFQKYCLGDSDCIFIHSVKKNVKVWEGEECEGKGMCGEGCVGKGSQMFGM